MIITHAFPPNPAASSIVHGNLFKNLSADSYVVLTARMHGAIKIGVIKEARLHFIFHSFEFISSKFHKLFSNIQKLWLHFIIDFYIKKYRPSIIMGVYPDLFWLEIAYEASKRNKLPFLPYFHDTVIEANIGNKYENWARELHYNILKDSKIIIVINEGMKSLYLSKYKREVNVIEHIYPEAYDFKNVFNKRKDSVLWSGDVYNINNHAIKRVIMALDIIGSRIHFTSKQNKKSLEGWGIIGDNVSNGFFPDRRHYIEELSKVKIVLLALNFEDESEMHFDELESIFPTKTPEYLASGAVLLVHCPKHYFLAQFIEKYNCGIVVSDPDVKALGKLIKDIFINFDNYTHYIENAYKALQIFDPDVVKNKLMGIILDLLKDGVKSDNN